MSEDSTSKRVIPGSGGCGCLITILLVIIAFIGGVYSSDSCRKPLDSLKEKILSYVQDKVDQTKEEVK